MGEQTRGEAGPAPESVEDQKYTELQTAMSEQKRLLQEMDGADEESLKDLMAQMDEVSKKFGEEWEAYKQAMEEARKEEAE